MFDGINGKGLMVGVIAWMIIIMWFAHDVSCMKWHNCSTGDFLLFAICAVGFIVPAGILASIVSSIFSDK